MASAYAKGRKGGRHENKRGAKRGCAGERKEVQPSWWRKFSRNWILGPSCELPRLTRSVWMREKSPGLSASAFGSGRQWQMPQIVTGKGRHTCKARWVTKSLMRLSGPPPPFLESRCSAIQDMQGQAAPMAGECAVHGPCTSPILIRDPDPRIRRAGKESSDRPSSRMARWCATGTASPLIARHGPCSMQCVCVSLSLDVPLQRTPNAAGAKQEASQFMSGRLQPCKLQQDPGLLTVVICHRHCQERKPGSPRGWQARGGCPLAQIDAPRRRRPALKAIGDRSWRQAESGRCVDGREQGHREDCSGCSHSLRCVCVRCLVSFVVV